MANWIFGVDFEEDGTRWLGFRQIGSRFLLDSDIREESRQHGNNLEFLLLKGHRMGRFFFLALCEKTSSEQEHAPDWFENEDTAEREFCRKYPQLKLAQ